MPLTTRLKTPEEIGEEMDVAYNAGIKYLTGQAADGYRQFRDAVTVLRRAQKSLRLVKELDKLSRSDPCSIRLDPMARKQIRETLEATQVFLETGEVTNDGRD